MLRSPPLRGFFVGCGLICHDAVPERRSRAFRDASGGHDDGEARTDILLRDGWTCRDGHRSNRTRTCPYQKSRPGWRRCSDGLPSAGMLDLLKLLGGFAVGLFRLQAAREAEMAFLRQQRDRRGGKPGLYF